MNVLNNWLALNDTLMIKSIFTVIIVLIVVYMYRLFFLNYSKNTEQRGPADVRVAGVDPAESVKKEFELEKLKFTEDIEQKNTFIEKLKTELADLRTKLAEVEASKSNIVEEAPDKDVESVDASVQMVAVETSTASNNQNTDELLKKIQSLEIRLAEYEIIAEEISELSSLKKENEELKSKLAGEVVNESAAENVKKNTNDEQETILNQFQSYLDKKESV